MKTQSSLLFSFFFFLMLLFSTTEITHAYLVSDDFYSYTLSVANPTYMLVNGITYFGFVNSPTTSNTDNLFIWSTKDGALDAIVVNTTLTWGDTQNNPHAFYGLYGHASKPLVYILARGYSTTREQLSYYWGYCNLTDGSITTITSYITSSTSGTGVKQTYVFSCHPIALGDVLFVAVFQGRIDSYSGTLQIFRSDTSSVASIYLTINGEPGDYETPYYLAGAVNENNPNLIHFILVQRYSRYIVKYVIDTGSVSLESAYLHNSKTNCPAYINNAMANQPRSSLMRVNKIRVYYKGGKNYIYVEYPAYFDNPNTVGAFYWTEYAVDASSSLGTSIYHFDKAMYVRNLIFTDKKDAFWYSPVDNKIYYSYYSNATEKYVLTDVKLESTPNINTFVCGQIYYYWSSENWKLYLYSGGKLFEIQIPEVAPSVPDVGHPDYWSSSIGLVISFMLPFALLFIPALLLASMIGLAGLISGLGLGALVCVVAGILPFWSIIFLALIFAFLLFKGARE
ncbi:MAG: hypothetical protein ACKD6O_08185 [Candidatus Bathyarchaeota archaeon]